MRKIIWQVGPAPVGRHKSFFSRPWPSATYDSRDGEMAFRISCKDSYEPALAKTGQHAELVLYIAEHNLRDKDPNAASWAWRKLKPCYSTLEEIKAAIPEILITFRNFAPPETV